ncbi:MAG: TIGR04255 family protein [Planctomycetota bacterium]|jgi:uncharacterized protein (TIGR04255 family)
MTIHEVFANPTVKKVIFQVRFPNLFSMDSLVGEYQRRIIERFPESKLLFSTHVVIARGNITELDLEHEKPSAGEEQAVQKIWNFKSGTGMELNVLTASLDMTSTTHKTYANPNYEDRFRDAIEFAVGRFLEVTGIPVFSRIGLRYINECPVPANDTRQFEEYYNTTLSLNRFSLEDAIELRLLARVRRGGFFLAFRESLDVTGDEAKLALDFDGFAENVRSAEYLSVTDRLHDLILAEYEASVKEPVYEFMRTPPE